MSEPKVNLHDLRIHEAPARKGRGVPWLLLLLFVPAAFLGGFVYRGRPGAMGSGALPVRVQVLERSGGAVRDTTGDVSEGGWVEVPSYHPIVVSALIPGRVDQLTVLEGSAVEAGDTVARLYAGDLEREVALADAEVAEKQARLDLLAAGYRKEEVEKARAEAAAAAEEAALAEKVAARTRELVPTGAASREDLERDASAHVTALAKARAADEERKRLEAGFRVEEVAEGRAALARAEAARELARLKLSYAEVKSPAKGVVLQRFVSPGSSLMGGNLAVVALYDPEDLQVRVDVRQENAGKVVVGQSVEVTTDAEPDHRYKGTVIRVDPLADLRKNTIQAKVKLLEAGERLHPEMICRVRFLSEGKAVAPAAAPGPLAVPAPAVVTDGGKTYVFLVRAGRAVRTEVKLAEERDGRREVLGGLAEGDRVVLAPAGLADGAEVSETK